MTVSRKSKAKKHQDGTVEFLALGCDKNLVDTERTLASLAAKGLKVVPSGAGAEYLLITTCSFIGPAKEESLEQILLAVERKKRGEIKKLVVAGCMVELYCDELKKEIPEVNLWVKFSELDYLADKMHGWLKGKTPAQAEPRFLTTPKHLSYLKISEGCDQGCRFCVIPKIRGRFRSMPMKALIEEAKFLERSGVKELNLVAQDLCDYGKDCGSSLTKLLVRLLKETRLPWLRLFYLNPEGITDELLELIRAEPRVCKYVDLPFQHISERVLKAMGRKAGEKKIRGLVEKIRTRLPGAALRGTALVGFPGETEKDFRELADFVGEADFDWLGVFAFSLEEQAAAFRLRGRVAEGTAQRRKEELEFFWSDLAAAKNSAKIGSVLEVLVDGRSDAGFDYQGRSQFQGYELDGLIQLKGEFEPGRFHLVRIIGQQGLDVLGEKTSQGEVI